jgi:hypothetical protein
MAFFALAFLAPLEATGAFLTPAPLTAFALGVAVLVVVAAIVETYNSLTISRLRDGYVKAFIYDEVRKNRMMWWSEEERRKEVKEGISQQQPEGTYDASPNEANHYICFPKVSLGMASNTDRRLALRLKHVSCEPWRRILTLDERHSWTEGITCAWSIAD